MLTSIRASARLVARGHLATLKRWHKFPASVGLVGQQPPASTRWDERNTRLFTSLPRLRQEVVAAAESTTLDAGAPSPLVNIETRERARKLPTVCPGCGAPSQTVDADAAGFYGAKQVTKSTHMTDSRREEDEVFKNALKSGILAGNASASQVTSPTETKTPNIPICDRCHNLLYQSKGTSIIHPSMHSIQQIIEESPHKHNHIYHVLDAADFPMSVIPNLQNALHLPRLRTQNRRSKSMHYIRGRTADVSFIITRADLLAPKKEQVDTLVPYMREVLRDALGRGGKDIRLGNLRCVSAKRGWWTKTVKEDIWDRGGAGWMVGKVNVGKSALYEVVFPKGRIQRDVDVKRIRNAERQEAGKEGMLALQDAMIKTAAEKTDPFGRMKTADSPGVLTDAQASPGAARSELEAFQESEVLLGSSAGGDDAQNDTFFDEDVDSSLLPPAQPETAYPRMPLVSALPGTTASPIRIPFGGGKGELIDLPGVHRSSLYTHVKPEHRSELVMKSREVPEQYTVKPGQSILIGGMIRITPKTDDLIFLAYPFVPLDAHITSTDKAIAISTGSHPDHTPYTGTISSIATESAKLAMKTAGTFKLEWDVTKRRAGPLTSPSAGKQKAANLPFIVYSADILIEGVGWIELVCQVRSRQRSFLTKTETVADALGEYKVKKQSAGVPEVEVFSPEGGLVDVRRPMGAWLLGGPKREAKHKRRRRPRQTIDYQRRKEGGRLGGLRRVED